MTIKNYSYENNRKKKFLINICLILKHFLIFDFIITKYLNLSN